MIRMITFSVIILQTTMLKQKETRKEEGERVRIRMRVREKKMSDIEAGRREGKKKIGALVLGNVH